MLVSGPSMESLCSGGMAIVVEYRRSLEMASVTYGYCDVMHRASRAAQ
jgi:hypothetical protein